LAGKPQSTIARIENGNMNASLKVLSEIAASVGRKLEIRFVDG
jgi:transcriptional regulator with XRE-family HTH domain